MLFTIFQRETTLYDILFACFSKKGSTLICKNLLLEGQILSFKSRTPERGLLLNVRIFSSRSKFFHLRVEPF